jgi:hypothetical protein
MSGLRLLFRVYLAPLAAQFSTTVAIGFDSLTSVFTRNRCPSAVTA